MKHQKDCKREEYGEVVDGVQKKRKKKRREEKAREGIID